MKILLIILFVISNLVSAKDSPFKFLIEKDDQLFSIIEEQSFSFILIDSYDGTTPKITKIEETDHYKLIYYTAGYSGTSITIKHHMVAVFDKEKKDFINRFPYKYECSDPKEKIQQPLFKISGKKIIHSK